MLCGFSAITGKLLGYKKRRTPGNVLNNNQVPGGNSNGIIVTDYVIISRVSIAVL